MARKRLAKKMAKKMAQSQNQNPAQIAASGLVPGPRGSQISPSLAGGSSGRDLKLNRNFGRASTWDTGKKFFSNMREGIYEAAGGDGWDVAKMVGGHALRGAVVGGGAGGVMEAAQGGSFWTGAKEGAWNGAVGWSAYRAWGKGVGASSKLPFGEGGVAGATRDRWGEARQSVSRSVEVLARHNSATQAARGVTKS